MVGRQLPSRCVAPRAHGAVASSQSSEHPSARSPSCPSLMSHGTMRTAATGSAHHQPSDALATSPRSNVTALPDRGHARQRADTRAQAPGSLRARRGGTTAVSLVRRSGLGAQRYVRLVVQNWHEELKHLVAVPRHTLTFAGLLCSVHDRYDALYQVAHTLDFFRTGVRQLGSDRGMGPCLIPDLAAVLVATVNFPFVATEHRTL